LEGIIFEGLFLFFRKRVGGIRFIDSIDVSKKRLYNMKKLKVL
jgi:hypothetical protein